jgi:hypothetical protein
MTKVINLCAGPGAGKSTTAAGLFYLMKLANLKVELVTEFAKDRTYNKSFLELNNQLFVLGEQDRRQRSLVGQVDYIITDSPLFLNSVYAEEPYDDVWFHEAVDAAFRTYDNICFFIERVKPYQTYGRTQTEQQAELLDGCIWDTLASYGPFYRVMGDESAPRVILDILERAR